MTRLGFNGAKEIKEHPFFSSVDFKAYENRQPDGNYAEVYPPQRKLHKITKKQKERAVEAKEEIYESAGVSQALANKNKIQQWEYVRD